MHKFLLDFKSFFFPSFYLKNNLFSLFYSGPFDYVKSDVVVGLKEGRCLLCLVHTLGKNVEKLITFFNLISRLAIEFNVVPYFLLNCGADGMLSNVSFYLIFCE